MIIAKNKKRKRTHEQHMQEAQRSQDEPSDHERMQKRQRSADEGSQQQGEISDEY